jgi:methylenetetrahydrofolate dehydrogenase (NADP+)/methenyltetrahydrofolate cyclohydrolase
MLRMTKLIDGGLHAEVLTEDTRRRAESFFRRHARKPRLDVILVGDNPASASYVRTKTKMAAEASIDGRLHRMQDEVSPGDLLRVLRSLNEDPNVDGILVQLPLPSDLDPQMVIEVIDPAKDVDAFHPINVGRLFTVNKVDPTVLLVPCTPLGCLLLLRSVIPPAGLTGKSAVVVGRSNIVGSPMARLLTNANCTVTIAHSKTLDLPGLCRTADIVVAAVGRPEFIRGGWIKEGAIILDVGINRVPTPDGKGKIVGDVATAEAIGRAAFLTPVPGGVGRMTVACLLHNTVTAAEMRMKGKSP